jgi:hypothetical protein
MDGMFAFPIQSAGIPLRCDDDVVRPSSGLRIQLTLLIVTSSMTT